METLDYGFCYFTPMTIVSFIFLALKNLPSFLSFLFLFLFFKAGNCLCWTQTAINFFLASTSSSDFHPQQSCFEFAPHSDSGVKGHVGV